MKPIRYDLLSMTAEELAQIPLDTLIVLYYRQIEEVEWAMEHYGDKQRRGQLTRFGQRSIERMREIVRRLEAKRDSERDCYD